MRRNIIISVLIVVIIISVTLLLSNRSTTTQEKIAEESSISSNVTIENNQQIITVTSKAGGYSPRTIYAKANTPTKLIINSQNSYGCERSFSLPKLQVYKTLPIEGETEIDLGSQTGTILGTCSMGMYTFTIKFI